MIRAKKTANNIDADVIAVLLLFRHKFRLAILINFIAVNKKL